jgi:hypothetical protein
LSENKKERKKEREKERKKERKKARERETKKEREKCQKKAREINHYSNVKSNQYFQDLLRFKNTQEVFSLRKNPQMWLLPC